MKRWKKWRHAELPYELPTNEMRERAEWAKRIIDNINVTEVAVSGRLQPGGSYAITITVKGVENG